MLRQEQLDGLRLNLERLSAAVGGKALAASRALNSQEPVASAMPLRNSQEPVASALPLREQPVSAIPINHDEFLLVAKLDFGSQGGGMCVSWQPGPLELARMAVGNAREAWMLSRELDDCRRASRDAPPQGEKLPLGKPGAKLMAESRSDTLRGDHPHRLESPHWDYEGTLGALRAMSSAMDIRDPYTFGHSQRVATLARELARLLGLDESASQEIYLAGMLHDIGKIGIPDAVLLKQSRLSEAEYAVIKNHPEIGYRIVEGIRHLHFALPGILHHHERWDGQGYPHGLRAESIPVMARILAVADAYDAMTSSRAYRRAMTARQALQAITAGSGIQWDPRMVGALAAWLQSASSSEGVAMLPSNNDTRDSSSETMHQALKAIGL